MENGKGFVVQALGRTSKIKVNASLVFATTVPSIVPFRLFPFPRARFLIFSLVHHGTALSQELLRTPLYAEALEKSLPRVVSTAASVLEGVKRRGREQGDIMDAATEEALKPQVRRGGLARMQATLSSSVARIRV